MPRAINLRLQPRAMLHCKLENGAGLSQTLGKDECESSFMVTNIDDCVDAFSLGSSDSWGKLD